MNGCWDWIGWYGADFDVKSGKQLTAMKQIIDRITAGFNPIAAPTGLQVTGTTDNSVSLSWSQVSGANGYNIYRNGVKVNSATVTGTTFTDNNLNSGSTYTYFIKALSTSGAESTSSDSVTAKTTGTPPAVQIPNGLTATDITPNSITLTWQVAAGAETYRVYRDGNKIADVNLLSYKDTSLTSGTQYKYQVSSVQGSQESDKSNEITATTSIEKVCFNDNNYNHVLAGRAYQSGGFVYANGSDQNMGLYNLFQRTNLCLTNANYYVIE
jgi:chitodextrinase